MKGEISTLWRATTTSQTTKFTKVSIRTDRMPRDSAHYVHNIFNWIYQQHYGVENVRSCCLFTTTEQSELGQYGSSRYAVFPLTGCRYIVSHSADSAGPIKWIVRDFIRFSEESLPDDQKSTLPWTGETLDKEQKLCQRKNYLAWIFSGRESVSLLKKTFSHPMDLQALKSIITKGEKEVWVMGPGAYLIPKSIITANEWNQKT